MSCRGNGFFYEGDNGGGDDNNNNINTIGEHHESQASKEDKEFVFIDYRNDSSNLSMGYSCRNDILYFKNIAEKNLRTNSQSTASH